MNAIRSRKAFTLIELIVVIIIIGILAALAVVSYEAVINRAKDNQVKVAALSVAREVQALASFDAYGAAGAAEFGDADPAADALFGAYVAEVTADAPGGIAIAGNAGTGVITVSGADGSYDVVLTGESAQSVAQNTPPVVETPGP